MGNIFNAIASEQKILIFAIPFIWDQKKFPGGWVGGGWKVTLVSVCVHFLKLLDTQTHRHRNGHRAWQ